MANYIIKFFSLAPNNSFKHFIKLKIVFPFVSFWDVSEFLMK